MILCSFVGIGKVSTIVSLSFEVPPFSVTVRNSPQGAIVGDPLDIQCTAVVTFNGVEPNSVLFRWSGPTGYFIKNDSRVTIGATIASSSTFISTLQFSYLMEGDEGSYTCNVMILRTTESKITKLERLNG